MNWTIAVIIICVIAGVFFTWQEVVRADRRRMIWRIVAVWSLATSLACIILPVSYMGDSATTDSSEAILLTDGFSKDSIPSGIRVYTTDKAIQQNYTKAVLWSSTAQAIKIAPAITKLHILGYGLEAHELEQLTNIPVSYGAPDVPNGIQAISWADKIYAGKALNVEGSYLNAGNQAVKLLLKSAGTSLDSVSIPAKSLVPFRLSDTPKALGLVVHQLLALKGIDTLSNDDIPFEVTAPSPIKILMLNASPNFETRFLKDWLGQNGYTVASRALISKNKFSEEYVNLGKMDLQHLRPGTLDRFDVVLGDLSALKALTAAENTVLRQQVTQKGLGVIIRADSSDNNISWLQAAFPVNTLSIKDQLSLPLILQGQKTRTAKLSIDPSFIGTRNNTQVLVTDAQNRALAATTIAGAGKLVFTTLNHTYTWVLAGDQKDHAGLWTLLIDKAARKAVPMPNWRTSSSLPTNDEPVELTLQSVTKPTDVMINGEKKAPIQNALIPFEWHIDHFAAKTGWQNIFWDQKKRSAWYNYPKTYWSTLKKLQKMQQTQRFASKHNSDRAVTKQIHQNIKIQIPKLWFYLIFLASCTFLWIERKFVV